MHKIHILHENDQWSTPLFGALEARELPYESWYLEEGRVDPGSTPPGGVFYNRMSASAHTRGHRYAPELTRQVLAWLEAYHRRVVNGSRALALEIDKMGQYRALAAAGIRVPRTLAGVGRGTERIRRTADAAERGSLGSGVRALQQIGGDTPREEDNPSLSIRM
jgi:glutathione synthase/RimK-type ligase-like ATP-grasp enzyme